MKTKQFDCVKMKRDIQMKIAKDYKGITSQEAEQVLAGRLEKNKILGRFVKQVRSKMIAK